MTRPLLSKTCVILFALRDLRNTTGGANDKVKTDNAAPHLRTRTSDERSGTGLE